MNKQLLQLKKEFGKYGSWALWDENGRITEIIEKPEFQSLIKPSIIFVGLNASMELLNLEDWINYHGECCRFGKIKSWKQTHASKLAEALREKEFEVFAGAYMTDIVKDDNNPNSNNIAKEANLHNIELFENELNLLSKISGSDEFRIICIGNKSFDILNKITKYKIDKIWHYSAYQLGWEGVKERIRQDLREIIKKIENKIA
ncbi:MAG: hypothetical protein WC472_02115 [Candidatus Paceibacterota bacterium]